jgi:hypothetical protein
MVIELLTQQQAFVREMNEGAHLGIHPGGPRAGLASTCIVRSCCDVMGGAGACHAERVAVLRGGRRASDAAWLSLATLLCRRHDRGGRGEKDH